MRPVIARARLKRVLPAKGWSSGSGCAPGGVPAGRRHLRVVAVEVGAERVGDDPRVQHAARHVEAEVGAVAHVDPEAAGHRLPDDGVHAAAPVHEAAGMARERVGQDVAGSEDLDHAGEDRVRIRVPAAGLGKRPELPEVDVEREIGLARDLRAQAKHRETPPGHPADLGVGLDAADEVPVLLRRADGGRDVDAVGPVERRVVVTLEPADDVGRQVCVNAGRGGLGDELPEARQRHAARTSLVDHGRRPGVDSDHVGLEAEAPGDVLVHVGVGIDQAREDDPAADVDDLARVVGPKRGRDHFDLSGPDAHVERGVQPLCGIDHAASAEHHVVRGSRHGVLLGPHPSTGPGLRRGRSGHAVGRARP